MTSWKRDYGPDQRHVVIIDRSGPGRPSKDFLRTASVLAQGRACDGFPIPCMDCAPNIVLRDYACDDCEQWHWGVCVAHDDTCPFNNGITDPHT